MNVRRVVALAILASATCGDPTAPGVPLSLRVVEPSAGVTVTTLDSVWLIGEATAEDIGLLPEDSVWWALGAVMLSPGRAHRALLPAGVHTAWFHARYGSRRDSIGTSVSVTGTGLGDILWTVPLDTNTEDGLTQALDGTLYATDDQDVVAIGLDGSVRFRATLPAQTPRLQPAIGPDGTLYWPHWGGGAAGGGGIFAMRPDGTVLWNFDTRAHGPPGSSFYHVHGHAAVGSDGTVYFTSEERDAPMYAVRLDGSLKWRVATNDSVLTGRFMGPTTLIGESLAVSIRQGGPARSGIVAVTTDSGVVRWVGVLSQQNNTSVGVAIGVDGAVYAAGPPGNVVVPCGPGNPGATCFLPGSNLMAFSAAGDSLWARLFDWDTRGGSPIVWQGRLFLANALGGVRVFALAGGDSLAVLGASSRFASPDLLGKSVTIGRGGVVYAAGDDTLFSYAPDGTLRWATAIPHDVLLAFAPIGGPVIGTDGTVYLRASNVGVVAFRDTVGPATDADWPTFQGNFQRQGRR